MAIPEEVLAQARTMLESAARPLFLFDDDCDGVTSFVMAYQFCKEGKGVPVKQSPKVKELFVRKVEEYSPDLVVVLDKPEISEEFLEKVKLPILWIDHHKPQDVKNVFYVNPRLWDDSDNRPTSYWVYHITKTNLWIATLGSVADWHLPEYIEDFKKEYSDLLPEKYEKVEDLYLDTPLGQLIKVLQFNLKGSISDMRKSVLTLTRIASPYEILQQSTSRGKFLWKKYKRLASDYDRHMNVARKAKPGVILLYEYDDRDMTFTSELSNELLIRYPERIILVCRKHDDKRKCSVRSKETELPSKIQEALKGLEGRGGGHTNACGVVVSEKDWKEFYSRLLKLVTPS